MSRSISWMAVSLVPIALVLAAALPAAAQELTPVPADSAAHPGLPSPGGAFLRSVMVPGWGQAAYGAYFRGGVYFAAQSGSWFMLVKTMAKLAEARSIEARRLAAATELARDSLLARAENDPALAEKYEDPLKLAMDVDVAAENNESVRDIRGLVGAREQQREDWVAWTLFWTLASGIDAFVNAHLSDFPARVAAEPRPGGGLSVGVQIPTRRRP